MVGELITLPVRIGVRATRMWLHAAEGVVSIAANAAELLLDATNRQSVRGPDPRDIAPRSEIDPAPPPRAPRPPAPPPPPAPPSPPAPPEPQRQGPPEVSAAPPAERHEPTPSATGEREPAHVSEEPVLVEEFAEPGAEDGAGAQVEVEAPWSGYDQMNAKQVIGRLAEATPEELAAVQLYESGHRSRHTILAAVQRELQSVSGGSRS